MELAGSLFAWVQQRVGVRACNWLLVLSSVLILAMTLVIYDVARVPEDGVIAQIALGLLGVTATLGVFFLWGGMWLHWRMTPWAGKWSKRFWAVVLFLGFWYGAVVYLYAVYLPRKGAIG